MNQEEQNLNLLSTFHYVLGVLTALLSSIPVIYLVIGIVMLNGTLNGGGLAPRSIALVFIILGLFMILTGWVLALLIIICGRRLKIRRSYNFCLVIAFLECLIVPFGTILGLFTVVTLTKDSVKELFS